MIRACVVALALTLGAGCVRQVELWRDDAGFPPDAEPVPDAFLIDDGLPPDAGFQLPPDAQPLPDGLPDASPLPDAP